MAETHAAAASTGLVLGRYQPLRPLGSGGTGSVWHAHDQKFDRPVALKIVPRTGTAGPRAEREATAAAHLQHPHCLRAYSLARDEGHVYIAYQYVPGRTLRHALQAGELDDAAAIEAAAQILEGLAHAHAHGIVHRDIKPSNVLLADEPGISVRLLDFGLALMTEEETLTAAGDVPGTLAYISPERLAGKTAEAATDVWSTGVLLWEALAGRHPFGSGPFLEIAKRIGRGAPSLAAARPDLPKPLVQLVDSALAVDPGRRPPAAALASSLRRAARARPRHARAHLPRLSVPNQLSRPLQRVLPVVPPALFAGWTAATLPFFPAHWSVALAVLAALLSLRTPRLGLVFALAVPVFPLGNIAQGLAILYLALACTWLACFWRRPRAALLFVVAPLIAPLGGLGLLPLVLLPAGGPARRAAQACAAMGAATVVARLSGHGLPIVGGTGPDLALGGIDGPRGAGSALWSGLSGMHGLLFETLALAGAAAAADVFRRRGPWAAAGYGALLCASTLLADPGATALPLVAAAWTSAFLLAVEPGAARRLPPLPGFVKRIPPLRSRLRPRLRFVAGS
jgi:hypothetical protein